MTKPISDTVKALKKSGIRKFFDIASEMKDVISLGVGEPDFETPWHIREEGIYSLERSKTFYTSNSGLKALRSEISNYIERTQGVKYDFNSEIMVTVGGSEAIDICLRAVLNPSDEVIIPQPSYVSYEPCTILAGGVPVIVNLKAENDFRLTADELRTAITEKTKVLILPYPNNPTGAILEKNDLKEIAEICREKDIYVLSDEIYGELTYKDKHISIISFEGMKERTVLINGFSKAYSMTGWRLGYALGPKHIIEQMLKIHQYAIMCAPTTSQYSAIEALKNGDDDIKLMRESYNQRRRFLINSFRRMKLECFEPFGAFYVFPCIKEFNMTSEEFALKFLEEERVVVIPGTAFGESGEGFVRISYAYSIDKLKIAMERLSSFVEKLRSKI